MTGARRWVASILIAVTTFSAGGWFLRRGTEGEMVASPAGEHLLQQVLTHIEQDAVDSLSEVELYRLAAIGLLEGLSDDYAALLLPEASRDLGERTTGNYTGVGVRVDFRDGTLTVIAPLPDSPAERAGIRTGDQIIEIDGRPMEGNLRELGQARLRGTAGTAVEIRVRRAGVAGVLPFTLARDTIHRRSVTPGVLLEDSAAYVIVNPIAERSAEELETELRRLKAAGMRSLILDLRGNPGGVLEQGVAIADVFLDRGLELVGIRGRTKDVNRTYVDGADQRYRDLPIIVLVNEGTASAAEIVAGALQDHDRALVLGRITFGKGIVQNLFPMGSEIVLRLTTARWYTPLGRSIQRERAESRVEGGQPDSTVAPSDSARERPVYRTALGRAVYGGGGIVPDVLITPSDSGPSPSRALADLLGERGGTYRDAITALALATKAAGALRDEAFEVTPVMIAALRQDLAVRGLRLPTTLPPAAETRIRRDLGNAIARYVFGREAEIRRRARSDATVREAIDLLRGVENPRTLLTQTATGLPPTDR